MKDRAEILAELTNILVEMFETELESITLEANLYEDLDIDSIDAVDLVVRLKEWTNVKISPEEFKNVRTIDDVVSAIEELFRRAP